RQCVSVACWLHALSTSFEEAYAEHVLQIGDCLGDNRWRHGKLDGRLAHAPEPSHCLKNVKVAKLKPSPHALIPRHLRTPEMVKTASDNTITYLKQKSIR